MAYLNGKRIPIVNYILLMAVLYKSSYIYYLDLGLYVIPFTLLDSCISRARARNITQIYMDSPHEDSQAAILRDPEDSPSGSSGSISWCHPEDSQAALILKTYSYKLVHCVHTFNFPLLRVDIALFRWSQADSRQAP